jgi:hypothetical protein
MYKVDLKAENRLEKLSKENATVLLHIQADMLGYHAVSLTYIRDIGGPDGVV